MYYNLFYNEITENYFFVRCSRLSEALKILEEHGLDFRKLQDLDNTYTKEQAEATGYKILE